MDNMVLNEKSDLSQKQKDPIFVSRGKRKLPMYHKVS